MKLKTLLVFVIGLVFLSVAALAMPYASTADMLPEIAAMPADDFASFMKGMDVLVGKSVVDDISKYSAITVKSVGELFGKQMIEFADDFTKRFKDIDELSASVKAGEHGAEVKKVYEGTLKASTAEQARVTTAFANLQNNVGAKIIKTEKEIESVVGKGNKLGADFISEIAGTSTGVSVKTAVEGVKDLESVSRHIINGAAELAEVRKSSGLWDEDVVQILVKSSDYDNAVKYADETFKNSKKLSEMVSKKIDPSKVRVIITKVDDYVVGGITK